MAAGSHPEQASEFYERASTTKTSRLDGIAATGLDHAAIRY
jgi:hypothetical protein